MKKTVGEIKFNDYYLVHEVCNCTFDEDDYGEIHRWCPLKCPLRDENSEPKCLLDLIKERNELDSKIKKFENVEIEVDEEKLRKLEKLQSKGLFTK